MNNMVQRTARLHMEKGVHVIWTKTMAMIHLVASQEQLCSQTSGMEWSMAFRRAEPILWGGGGGEGVSKGGGS